MADHWLVCTRCGSEFAPGPYFLGCPDCVGRLPGPALEVRYDLEGERFVSIVDGTTLRVRADPRWRAVPAPGRVTQPGPTVEDM